MKRIWAHPVFVNIDDDAYPLYTAERGTEKWQPVYIGNIDEIIGNYKKTLNPVK